MIELPPPETLNCSGCRNIVHGGCHFVRPFPRHVIIDARRPETDPYFRNFPVTLGLCSTASKRALSPEHTRESPACHGAAADFPRRPSRRHSASGYLRLRGRRDRGQGVSRRTLADIVRRAKVSRAAFYLHFRSREDCFFAATRRGGQRLYGRVIEAARAVPDDAPDEEALRTGCRAYLCFLADEPAFARVFFIDMPAAGPAAVEHDCRPLAAGSPKSTPSGTGGLEPATPTGPPSRTRPTRPWPAPPPN